MSTAYKVVVLGEGAVGKSCLTIRYVQGTFVTEYDPTIENSYRRIATVDEQPVVLDILDTAGQEEYASMRDTYLRVGHGFLLVFSVTSLSSLLFTKELHSKILQVKEADSCPMVLVGNKADMRDQRVVKEGEAQETAKQLGIPYVETSAKTGMNIELAFNTVVKQLIAAPKGGPSDGTNGDPVQRPKKNGTRGCTLL